MYGCAGESHDVGCASKLLTVGEHEGWRSNDAVLFGELWLIFRIDAGVADTGLVKGADGDLTIWAGVGGEEQILALSRFWLLGLFFSCGDAEVAAFDFHDKAALGEIVELAILEFLSLAVVPVLHWAIVAGDAAVDFGLVACRSGR